MQFRVCLLVMLRSSYSVLAMGWTLRSSSPLKGHTIFSSPYHPDQLGSPLRLIFRFVPVTLSLVVKATGLASSAEVRNERSFTSTPPACLHGIERDNLMFL